jgi:hypothetical protein
MPEFTSLSSFRATPAKSKAAFLLGGDGKGAIRPHGRVHRSNFMDEAGAMTDHFTLAAGLQAVIAVVAITMAAGNYTLARADHESSHYLVPHVVAVGAAAKTDQLTFESMSLVAMVNETEVPLTLDDVVGGAAAIVANATTFRQASATEVLYNNHEGAKWAQVFFAILAGIVFLYCTFSLGRKAWRGELLEDIEDGLIQLYRKNYGTYLPARTAFLTIFYFAHIGGAVTSLVYIAWICQHWFHTHKDIDVYYQISTVGLVAVIMGAGATLVSFFVRLIGKGIDNLHTRNLVREWHRDDDDVTFNPDGKYGPYELERRGQKQA